MRFRAGIPTLVVALATALGVVGAVGPASGAAAAAPYCTPPAGVTTYRWTGHAGNGLFSDAQNWSSHQVPGLLTDTPTDYACIPASADVSLLGGEEADLQGLDSRGALNLEEGSKLFVGSKLGAATAPDSRVQNLTVHGATLGGTATVTVYGALEWTSLPPDGAATMTTRALEDISGSSPAYTGRTVITPTATMSVDGGNVNDGGVNLRDDRVVDIYGTATTSNGGFVAADWGTAVRLLVQGSHKGRLVFENDGGVYQGFTNADLPWETARATVLNAGQIVKEPGSMPGSSEGTSVIDAQYVKDDGAGHTGTVDVESGTVTIFGTDASASVHAGAAIGFGGCPDATAVCSQPTTDAADPQLATFRVAAGASAVAVTLDAPLATNPYNRALVGDPVVLTTPTRATASTLVLRVDHTLTNGAKLSQMAVGRNGHVLPSCTTGTPPCLLSAQKAPDDSGDFMLSVMTPRGGKFTTLGPRFR